jgi:hypothetical protein
MEAQPFAEAIVCAIDLILGCAADENKYRGFHCVASIVAAKPGKSTGGSSPAAPQSGDQLLEVGHRSTWAFCRC